MKVSRTGRAKETTGSKRKTKNSRAGAETFVNSLRDTRPPSTSALAKEPPTVSGAEAILAAQNVGISNDDMPKRKRLAEFGEDVLDRLDELRVGILSGAFSKEKLTELARKLRQKRQQSSDPKLNRIIQEIELRAEVEIAKYSRPIRDKLN